MVLNVVLLPVCTGAWRPVQPLPTGFVDVTDETLQLTLFENFLEQGRRVPAVVERDRSDLAIARAPVVVAETHIRSGAIQPNESTSGRGSATLRIAQC